MIDFPKLEERTLKFWQKKKVFEKLQKKNKSRKPWSFIDGPITANNPMGVHHAWGRTYKDLYQRFKAMQGFDQRFQNGFDCQGLWVEVEVEKDLGFKSKADIEKFGLPEFSKKCRERVEKFSKIQTEQSIRLGQWMDWKNSYYTMSDQNIEAIWYFLKQCYRKGWLYKDHKVVLYCPRCGTPLSQHEMTDSYRQITEKSVYVKFELKDEPGTYLLAWTTTPWTLPGNSALYLDPGIKYVKIEVERGGKKKRYILAKPCLRVIDEKYKIIQELKPKELIGRAYKPLFPCFKGMDPKYYHIDQADFVQTEQGTGLVHSAIMYGEEDFKRAKEQGLKENHIIDENGKIKDSLPPFSGMFFKDADPHIIEYLKKKGLVYKTEKTTHKYPFCWRCASPVLYYAHDVWFIRVDEIRPKMKKEAKKVKWYPPYVGKLMQDWLTNMGDWNISRKRYWGLPLMFYPCSCGNIEVIGSVKELKEKAEAPAEVDKLPELHRPWIDKIKIKCPKCKKPVSRIKEVGDCWLDAGIVPFSTLKYFEDKNYWRKWFPADFICEARPQVRLWFYATLFMAVTLKGETPYKSVLAYEEVRDEKGESMHKSKGNVIWFDDAAEKMGADVMRWMYMLQNPAFNLNFGFKKAGEIQQSFFRALYHSFLFFKTYASSFFPSLLHSFTPSLLDKWILSRLNQLIKAVTENLNNLKPHLASQAIFNFVLNDLSNWYIRRSRKREERVFYQTLYEVLLTLVKISAPFIPFIAEEIYQNLTARSKQRAESVHLETWPKFSEKLIDQNLNRKMTLVSKICELGLGIRAEAKIKVRQPLSELKIENLDLKKEFLELIKDELNVKEVKIVRKLGKLDKSWRLKQDGELKVALDTAITPSLKQEGYARQIVRHIQELRKESDLKPTNTVSTFWETTDKDLLDVFKKFGEDIKKETRSKEIRELKGAKRMRGKEVNIEGKKLQIEVEKI